MSNVQIALWDYIHEIDLNWSKLSRSETIELQNYHDEADMLLRTGNILEYNNKANLIRDKLIELQKIYGCKPINEKEQNIINQLIS